MAGSRLTHERGESYMLGIESSATRIVAGGGGAPMLFEGFALELVDTGEVKIRVRSGGSGPPLLLLHGHPQTHAMWHAVAPVLARDFTVIAPDLRGYGDSSKPATTPDHMPYAKRTMALDQVALMRHFGFERFRVAGHDRGGRVGYRLALDHPERVERLAVLDIIPTAEVFQRMDRSLGLAYWHWFFLAQPHPLPEDLLSPNPDSYYFRGNRDRFHPDALADYLRCVHDPATIHGMCEDYRAGATIDVVFDEENQKQGRGISCPLLVLWGGRGPLARRVDTLAIWRTWANDVRGRALDCGHYLAEEKPDETAAELAAFFRD